jgi:release factor glutamine methyltransferase
MILPGVFHPGFFFSTKFLISEIEKENLYKKTFLELGAGSGLISFVAEKLGATVISTDISEIALRNLELNKSTLHSKIEIVKSDLFDSIPQTHFDFIIINPPYYPKKVENENQLAWYCGEHFEYFEKLFKQLAQRKTLIGRILMVLSEDCDIIKIRNLARENGFEMKERIKKKFYWEWNYIFEITITATT